ncbi:MAG: carbon monoxide dehydrogenase [Rhizobiales bacterium]|nr:carbon monoxide dehydrogenase [Hyphomicrobiales bacterium]
MYSFNYVRPASVAEAVAALADPDARPIAGGHTLIPTLKMRLARPSTLVDISRIPELKGIHRDGGAIGIGAATTHAEIARHPELRAKLPALARLAEGIGDAQVRHRGTIGGSLANNDPAADYPAAMLAIGATIVTNRRNIPADQYFTGLFSTALEQGEMITGIGFQIPDRSGYAKFEQRASRYALTGVFVAKSSGGVRVAVTGAGENGVFRSPELEAALAASFTPAAAAGVALSANGLMSDMHGSADYRAALIVAMAEQAVASAS